MSCKDNYIIIEDYFEVKQRVLSLEDKNKELENRLRYLEQLVLKYVYEKEHPGPLKRITKTYDTLFSYYEKIKLINLVILFFVSNKILSEPRLLLKFYTILKHSITYLYS